MTEIDLKPCPGCEQLLAERKRLYEDSDYAWARCDEARSALDQTHTSDEAMLMQAAPMWAKMHTETSARAVDGGEAIAAGVAMAVDALRVIRDRGTAGDIVDLPEVGDWGEP